MEGEFMMTECVNRNDSKALWGGKEQEKEELPGQADEEGDISKDN